MFTKLNWTPNAAEEKDFINTEKFKFIQSF